MKLIQQSSFRPVDVRSADGGLSLLWWGSSSCGLLEYCEVEETASQVTITLFEAWEPDGPAYRIEPCTVFVPLVAPLGDRTVHDGSQPHLVTNAA